MKILVINNGTKHLTALKHLLSKHQLTIDEFDQAYSPISNFDLVVLSGSSWYSVVENPEVYQKEINIVKTAKVPIIGICLGCELIARTYGAILKELPEREHGINQITMLKNPYLKNERVFSAFEAHEWAVTKLSKKLIGLAKSQDGFEIIKVKNRPVFGLQFHPEMLRDKTEGKMIFNQVLKYIYEM